MNLPMPIYSASSNNSWLLWPKAVNYGPVPNWAAMALLVHSAIPMPPILTPKPIRNFKKLGKVVPLWEMRSTGALEIRWKSNYWPQTTEK